VIELVKGANARLTGPSIRASVRTSLGPDQIDVCAVLVNAQRQVRGDADFVFFNHKRSGCGSTRLVSPVELQVDLHRLPPDVDRVVIAAALDDGLPGSVESNGGGGFVVHDGSNTFGHTFDGLSTERCVIAAEIYRRHDGWKLRAVSQGYDDLVGLVTAYGIQTEEEAPAPADSRHPSAGGSIHTDEPRADLDRPEPAGNRSAPSSSLPPAETREVIDRVRIGAAARRAAAVPGRRRATVFPSARRGNVTATQYKAQRRAEAEQLTAEVQHQIRQLETVMTQLPYPDISPAALDELLDASTQNNARNRWALFKRRAQNPRPIPPSQTLGRVVRQLRELAAEAHQDAIEGWLWLGLFATDLQPSFGHVERVGVQAQQRRVILDIAVPDRTLVPGHSRVRYKAVIDRHEPSRCPIATTHGSSRR
jgi:stress response protein SCP2